MKVPVFINAIIATMASVLAFLQPSVANTPVKIGVATIGGAYAGQDTFGADAARKWINGRGGVLGQDVEIVVLPDECNPAGAKSVAKRFVREEKVHAVIGHPCGSAAVSAAPIYADAKVLFLPLSDLPSLVKEHSPGTFRLCGREDTQATIVARYLKDTYSDKNIGGIFPPGTYGQTIRIAAENEMPQAFKLVQEISDISNVDGLVDELARGNIDAAMVAGASPEFTKELAIQSTKFNLDTRFVFDSGLAASTFVESAGGKGGETLFTTTCLVPFVDQELVEMVGDRIDLGKIEHIGRSLHVFAGLEVIAEAARASGELEFSNMVEAMHSKSFDTAIGTFSFLIVLGR